MLLYNPFVSKNKSLSNLIIVKLQNLAQTILATTVLEGVIQKVSLGGGRRSEWKPDPSPSLAAAIVFGKPVKSYFQRSLADYRRHACGRGTITALAVYTAKTIIVAISSVGIVTTPGKTTRKRFSPKSRRKRDGKTTRKTTGRKKKCVRTIVRSRWPYVTRLWLKKRSSRGFFFFFCYDTEERSLELIRNS